MIRGVRVMKLYPNAPMAPMTMRMTTTSGVETRVAQALPQLGEYRLPGQARDQVQLARPHGEERDDDGQEAGRVEVEARGEAEGG